MSQQLSLDFSSKPTAEDLTIQIEELKDQEKRLEADLAMLYKVRLAKMAKRQAICEHKNTFDKVEKISGDYFNVGRTLTCKICTLCEKELHVSTKLGHYG